MSVSVSSATRVKLPNAHSTLILLRCSFETFAQTIDHINYWIITTKESRSEANAGSALSSTTFLCIYVGSVGQEC